MSHEETIGYWERGVDLWGLHGLLGHRWAVAGVCGLWFELSPLLPVLLMRHLGSHGCSAARPWRRASRMEERGESTGGVYLAETL